MAGVAGAAVLDEGVLALGSTASPLVNGVSDFKDSEREVRLLSLLTVMLEPVCKFGTGTVRVFCLRFTCRYGSIPIGACCLPGTSKGVIKLPRAQFYNGL